MFPPTDFLFEKRIGLAFMNLIYIISTYYTQVNQHECFKLAQQLIFLMVFDAVDEPLASCMMVQL